MENSKDYRVLALNNDEQEMIIVSASQIERSPLYLCYSNYGQQIGHTDAGDYAIDNYYSSAAHDCKKALTEKFDLDVEADDFELEEETENTYVFDNSEFDFSEEKVIAINKFIAKWQEENENYTEVTCINYWDGSNHQTLLVDEDEYVSASTVDSETEKEILKAFDNTEFGEWECGFRRANSGGYHFLESQYEKHFEIASIEK